MHSTLHHIAQARVTVQTLTDAPHQALLSAHAAALDELRAAAQETEKLARVHPATIAKEAAIGGFSAFSLLSVLVFGRSLANFYLQMRRQVSNIEVPFFDVRGQAEKILPPVPWLEQAARLPEISWEQAIIGALAVAAVILIYHVVKSVMLLRRERLLAHSAQALTEAARLVREAAVLPRREDALSLLAQGMEKQA